MLLSSPSFAAVCANCSKNIGWPIVSGFGLTDKREETKRKSSKGVEVHDSLAGFTMFCLNVLVVFNAVDIS